VEYDKLYCNKQNIRSLLQSLFAVGCAIGMASMPIIGDIIGRRKTILLALLLNVLSTSLLLIGINYNVEFIMMIGIVLAGASSQGISSIGFISTCDFC
jgi:MFS family permease